VAGANLLRAALKAAALLAALAVPAAAHFAVTVEIRGRVTNAFPEEKLRSAVVIITDRLGVELGRARPDSRGQYELKITGPRYIIVKAQLEGFPDALYQIDTEDIRESTTDREENKAFGELRIPTYFQNITFGGKERPATLESLLEREDPSAVKAYRAALGQKEAGNVKAALAAVEKLTRDYPSFYFGHIEFGMLLAAQQENDRALAAFAQAMKLRPEHSWAYVGSGIALNNKQDHAAAAQHLEKAVQMEPGSILAQFHLGTAAFKLGNQERARQCFEQVVALNPKFNPLVYKTLASISVARQDAQGAIKALESYLTHFPDAPDREKVKQILAKLGR
jgi:tetratricopeptide (TPR) repeat protein